MRWRPGAGSSSPRFTSSRATCRWKTSWRGAKPFRVTARTEEEPRRYRAAGFPSVQPVGADLRREHPARRQNPGGRRAVHAGPRPLPETISRAGMPASEVPSAAEEPDGRTARLPGSMARKGGTNPVAGHRVRDDGRTFNRALVFGRDGKLAGSRGKVHPVGSRGGGRGSAGPRQARSTWASHGSALPSASTSTGLRSGRSRHPARSTSPVGSRPATERFACAAMPGRLGIPSPPR